MEIKDIELQEKLLDKENKKLNEKVKTPSRSHIGASPKVIIKKSVAFHFDQGLPYSVAILNFIKCSIPSIIVLSMLFTNETINYHFAGNFSSNEISAIGLGGFYINAIGFVFGIGLLGGLDTLCSQAFGAKQNYVVGMFANFGRICVFAYSLIVIIPMTFFCGSIFNYVQQNEEIVSMSSSYARSLIPFIIFGLQFITNIRYLQSINIFLPGMCITIITTFLHIIWCYIMTTYTMLGTTGIGFAMGITSLLNYSLSFIYIKFFNPFPKTYVPLSYSSFDINRLIQFLTLAIPSAIMFASDWLGFEVIILLSSFLNKNSLAANVILFNYITLLNTIPMGISLCTSSFVGISVGGSKEYTAKIYTLISAGSGFVASIIIYVILSLTKNSFPNIYTKEFIVTVLIQDIMKIYLFYGFINAFQIILNGVIRGIGKQKTASILVIMILYTINLPLGLTLAFVVNYGLVGLWMSQLTSVILLAFVYILLIICFDWDKIVIRSIVKIKILGESIKRGIEAENFVLS